MTDIDIYSEIAALLHPIPDEPTESTAVGDLAYDEFTDHAMTMREQTARQLRDASDQTGDDPLLAAIAQAAGDRETAEERVRVLTAYARSHAPGGKERYTLRVLAPAAGLGESTVNRAANDAEAVTRVRRMIERQRPDVLADTEFHAMHNLYLIIEHSNPDQRRQILADLEGRARYLFPQFDDAAIGRVVDYVRSRTTTQQGARP